MVSYELIERRESEIVALGERASKCLKNVNLENPIDEHMLHSNTIFTSDNQRHSVTVDGTDRKFTIQSAKQMNRASFIHGIKFST